MAAYTSKANGDWNADGATTWNEAGHPDGADDTASVTHTLTAAAAVVCGAITVSGAGAITATAAANTITSLANSGTGAVNLGATTFVGAINNSSSGALTASGAWTGVTNLTCGNFTMSANVTMSGTFTGPASGRTFAQGAYTLSGATASVASFVGAWTMAAGAAFTFNSASTLTITIGAGGSMTLNGTSANVVQITNSGAGGASVVLSGSIATGGTFTGTYYTIETYLTSNFAYASINSSYGAHGLYLAIAPKTLQINHAYLNNGITGAAGVSTSAVLMNCAIGYNRDGSSAGLTTGITTGLRLRLVNCIIDATTQVAALLSEVGCVIVDNLGYLDPAMLPGTSSDLDDDVVDAGISKTWLYTGTIERSAVNPRTGTYHLRLTPSSIVTATVPLECAVNVPIKSGDSLSISVWASRSGDTSDCVEMVGDPEQAWFTTVTSTELLTNTATYYRLTVALATAGGTGAKGKVRVVFRVKEYTAGQYVDVDDLAIA